MFWNRAARTVIIVKAGESVRLREEFEKDVIYRAWPPDLLALRIVMIDLQQESS